MRYNEVISIPRITIFLNVFVYVSGTNDYTFTRSVGTCLCS